MIFNTKISLTPFLRRERLGLLSDTLRLGLPKVSSPNRIAIRSAVLAL